MGRFKLLVPAAILLVALGCDEDDDEIGDGTVEGRVEATTQPFANVAAMKFAPQQVGAGTTAETAVVGQIESDGGLEVLATGDVGSDARFTVTGVPASRTRLVAEVRDEGNDAVGRSIVHIGPDEGEVVPVAAINGETTAEANVFAELRSRGNAAGSIATPEITAKLEFADDAEARAAAVTDSEIDALADAFAAAQDAFLDGLSRFDTDVDANDLQAAGGDAAQLYAALRDDGTGQEEAEETFLEALADGYAEAGLSFEAQSQAGSAATASGVAATGDATAVLAVLRGAGTQMAAARALLAIAALTELGASSASTQVVANARTTLDADVSAATTVDDVLDAFAVFQETLLEQLEATVDAQLGIDAAEFLDLQVAVAGANLDVTLAAALAVATSTGAIVDAYINFYDALRSIVVGTLTATGIAEADAELVADVFVAADAGLDAIDF